MTSLFIGLIIGAAPIETDKIAHVGTSYFLCDFSDAFLARVDSKRSPWVDRAFIVASVLALGYSKETVDRKWDPGDIRANWIGVSLFIVVKLIRGKR